MDQILFSWKGYDMTYLEFIGCVFGMIAVIYAIRSNIYTWFAALINIVCFVILFYQIQLYADMLLQIFFFISSAYGWVYWHQKKNTLAIARLTFNQMIVSFFSIVILSFALYFLITNLHSLFPSLFQKPASFALLDSFIAAMSIVATILMSYKKVENWLLWVFINILSVFLYYQKAVYLISLEYFIFMILGVMGYIKWKKKIAMN